MQITTPDESSWRAEATAVIEAWEQCFDLLPEQVRQSSLGLRRSSVVAGYLRAVCRVPDGVNEPRPVEHAVALLTALRHDGKPGYTEALQQVPVAYLGNVIEILARSLLEHIELACVESGTPMDDALVNIGRAVAEQSEEIRSYLRGRGNPD